MKERGIDYNWLSSIDINHICMMICIIKCNANMTEVSIGYRVLFAAIGCAKDTVMIE